MAFPSLHIPHPIIRAREGSAAGSPSEWQHKLNSPCCRVGELKRMSPQNISLRTGNSLENLRLIAAMHMLTCDTFLGENRTEDR